VEWTAGPEQQKQQLQKGRETAATAPRSQRYWDEHNIERPDYAKTDYELARDRLKEKLKGSQQKRQQEELSSKNGLSFESKIGLFALLALLVYELYSVTMIGKSLEELERERGHVLGNADGSTSESSEVTVEDSRKARLARFEKKDDKKKK